MQGMPKPAPHRLHRGRRFGGVTLLSASLVILLPSAHADKPAPTEPLWEIGAVGVAVSQQAWPGAAEEVQRVLALPYVLYRGPLLRIDRGSAGLRALRRGNFELDIGVAGAFGSASKETQERQGMPRLGTLVEFGPRGIWELGSAPGGGRWRAELPLRGVFDLHDRLASRGWALEPELQYRHDGIAGWRLNASAGALLGDRRLNGTFYDVGTAYATTSRAAYEARGGLISWRLGLTASHRLSPEWRVFGFGRIDLVSGAANADSPLVTRQTGFTGGVGLQWTWMQSSQPASD
jgi:outer membrane scaffolding protein for murein synthesis (MipA/OmpV family)